MLLSPISTAKLLRVHQWYKNLLVFIALFFEGLFTTPVAVAAASLGFLVTCLASSANYIINDVVDKERDAHNPLKDNPVQKDQVSEKEALIVFIVVLSIAIAGAAFLDVQFLLLVLIIIGLGQLYNFLARKVLAVDMAVLVGIYVVRVVAGYVLVGRAFYPLLILPVSLVACLLMVVKKASILQAVGPERATDYRSSFKHYTGARLKWLTTATAVALCAAYVIYVVFSPKFFKPLHLATIPFALLLVLSLVRHVEKHPRAGVNLWRALANPVILFSGLAVGCLYIALLVL